MTAPIREELMALLKNYQDIFAWLYHDMPGLSSLKLWKEKLERKVKEKERVKINQDKREQIREEERRKIQ